MHRQKSAEAIVGVITNRRAEHEVPRVGGGNLRKADEGGSWSGRSGGYSRQRTESAGGCGSRRGGHGDPFADESGGGGNESDGSRGGTRQLEARVSAGDREQRCGGGGSTRGARTQGSPETTLAEHSGQTAGGQLSTAAGTPGGHSQAARRGTHAGHSDSGGSADPAGIASSAATDLRADLLGRELRLPAGQEYASGGEASAGWWTWTWRSSSTGSTTIS